MEPFHVAVDEAAGGAPGGWLPGGGALAAGLSDSPAGQAAWIVEKFRAWSDCGGDLERGGHFHRQ